MWARSFDAYGADAGTWTSPGYLGTMSRLGWHGHYRDDSGLLYVQARVYDRLRVGTSLRIPPLTSPGMRTGTNFNSVAFTSRYARRNCTTASHIMIKPMTTMTTASSQIGTAKLPQCRPPANWVTCSGVRSTNAKTVRRTRSTA